MSKPLRDELRFNWSLSRVGGWAISKKKVEGLRFGGNNLPTKGWWA